MSFYSGSLLFTSLASLVLGIFVYLKGREKLPNVILALFSVAMALWCFGQFMGEVSDSKELVLFWTREGIAGAIFLSVFFLHFVLSLIGRVTAEKKLLLFVYFSGVIFLLLDFTPFFVKDVVPALGFRYYPAPGIVYPFFALFIVACFCYGFWRLFQAYQVAIGARRNQFLYVLLASLIGFLGGITAFFPIWGINFPVLSHFSLPLYVLITIYAILKHKLLDISVIVREGLVYSALTVLFAGFYVLVILVANYFFSSYVRFNPILAVFLVVFASVLVFQPIRDRVQNIVDRLFFMGEYRYQKTINDLSVENKKLFYSLLRADKLASLGTLSAGMAHEIKNPLASLKAMTQVLDENIEDKDFIKKYQGVVERQIDRINGIVEKLLKFGQPQQLEVNEFDLNQVIEETLNLFDNQCQKTNIEIKKQMAQLPKINGDAEQIAQVFTNLILNAIQAMPQGGILTIKTSAKDSDLLAIEISDTGIGIPHDKIDKIFDPFYSTKEKGTGMGLAVAYRSVKEHQGDIQVESAPGKGTKFSIWLPIRPKRSV